MVEVFSDSEPCTRSCQAISVVAPVAEAVAFETQDTVEAFLGVERSLTGKRWRLRLADERAALLLSQRLEVPEIVGRILAARGVTSEEGEAFLDPTLRHYMPDPTTLHDMKVAASRIHRALRDGETIAVFADYDVDGATSCALLLRFLSVVGGKTVFYVPDRMAEGYGPNEAALKNLHAEGAALVITVDCGITAFAPLAAAARMGLDVIVVDHHEAEPSLPEACAVVDPNRLDESDGFGHLAAVGVAYLLVVAVNRLLREEGWYDEMRPEPDLMQWLDLVALGTVCDVVPLKGLNRAYVAQGLKIMSRRGNAGLMALADVAGVREKPGDYHLGFILGPRVNAGGRVGRADLGTRLLSCDDPAAAHIMAVDLDAFNQKRRVIEAGVLEAATRQVEEEASAASVLFAAGEGWHPGVIGIVAGRLKERFNKPACVFALDRGMAKGSGRSVPGIDLGAAVIAARQVGLLVNGGGHAMAAGMTVDEDKIPELKTFLTERLSDDPSGVGIPALELKLDGALSISGATRDLMASLERAAPFGSGNPEPRFVLPHMAVAKADVVGENHVRCFLSDAGHGRLKAIAFRSLDTLLGPTLLNNRGETLHIAGRLRIDSWQEQTRIQLMIDDAAPT